MTRKTYDQITALVAEHNKATDFSDALIVALAWKESSFDETVKNPAPGSTATGLMQITVGALQDVNNNTPAGVHFEHSEMIVGGRNIECGTYYLQILFGRHGSKRAALSHYGTGDSYADQLLACETCLASTPGRWKDCLSAIHGFVGV